MSSSRWVIVADSTRCRIFAQDKRFGPLVELDDLVHPSSRLRDGDSLADRPGRSFDSRGSGRHAMEPPHDPHEEEARRFAREIADRLGEARATNAVEALVLIAEPRFLGYLREHIDDPSRKIIELEIPANLAQADTDTILDKVKETFER